MEIMKQTTKIVLACELDEEKVKRLHIARRLETGELYPLSKKRPGA